MCMCFVLTYFFLCLCIGPLCMACHKAHRHIKTVRVYFDFKYDWRQCQKQKHASKINNVNVIFGFFSHLLFSHLNCRSVRYHDFWRHVQMSRNHNWLTAFSMYDNIIYASGSKTCWRYEIPDLMCTMIRLDCNSSNKLNANMASFFIRFHWKIRQYKQEMNI